ncbi:MAG: hypothetical protein Q9170_003079 [Blastenia crenularia]
MDDLKQLNQSSFTAHDEPTTSEEDFSDFQAPTEPQDTAIQVPSYADEDFTNHQAETADYVDDTPDTAEVDNPHTKPESSYEHHPRIVPSTPFYKSANSPTTEPYSGIFLSLCRPLLTEAAEWAAEKAVVDESHTHLPLILPPILDGNRTF